MKKRTLTFAIGALLLVACKDDENAMVMDNSAVGTVNTLIATRSSELTLPSDLDALGITDEGTDDTSLPISIN